MQVAPGAVRSAPAPSALRWRAHHGAWTAGATRTSYGNLKRALLDQLGLTPEDTCTHCRFQSLRLADGDWPFAYVHQVLDAAGRWLRPEEWRGVATGHIRVGDVLPSRHLGRRHQAGVGSSVTPPEGPAWRGGGGGGIPCSALSWHQGEDQNPITHTPPCTTHVPCSAAMVEPSGPGPDLPRPSLRHSPRGPTGSPSSTGTELLALWPTWAHAAGVPTDGSGAGGLSRRSAGLRSRSEK